MQRCSCRGAGCAILIPFPSPRTSLRTPSSASCRTALNLTNCAPRPQKYGTDEHPAILRDICANYNRPAQNTTSAPTTDGHTLRATASCSLSTGAYLHMNWLPRRRMAPRQRPRPRRASRGRSKRRPTACPLSRAQSAQNQSSMETPWTLTTTVLYRLQQAQTVPAQSPSLRLPKQSQHQSPTYPYQLCVLAPTH